MHPSLLSSLAFSLLVTVGVACTSTTATPEETSSTSQAVYSCSDTCDCPYGNYCYEGACTVDFSPLAHCYCAAHDCGAGQACTDGFCTGGSGGGGGGGGGCNGCNEN